MIGEGHYIDLEKWESLIQEKLEMDIFVVRADDEFGVFVVTPDLITTMDYRSDHGRFYPETDGNNVVIGGDFH